MENSQMSFKLYNRRILKPWIDENGYVDYQAIKKSDEFKRLLKFVEETPIDSLNEKEQFAFWLNAYNLLTIKNVLIELEKNPKWRGNTSLWSKIRFFYLRKFKVAGKKYHLYAIENKILRKRFKDPRIHFALNCGSVSCPVLPSLLFEAEMLDSSLDSLTRAFINNPKNVYFDEKNKILYLNRIFKWYKKDFNPYGGVIPFIKKYLDDGTNLPENISIKYFQYNWELNVQKK